MSADDFVERPLLYRAFLGGHWNDDGLRLNLTLPTATYWMVGAEAFRGRRLVAECTAFARHASYRCIRLWTQQELGAARASQAARAGRCWRSNAQPSRYSTSALMSAM